LVRGVRMNRRKFPGAVLPACALFKRESTSMWLNPHEHFSWSTGNRSGKRCEVQLSSSSTGWIDAFGLCRKVLPTGSFHKNAFVINLQTISQKVRQKSTHSSLHRRIAAASSMLNHLLPFSNCMVTSQCSMGNIRCGRIASFFMHDMPVAEIIKRLAKK